MLSFSETSPGFFAMLRMTWFALPDYINEFAGDVDDFFDFA